MNDLPYLQSERHFRRYETFLWHIVNEWPRMVDFQPTPPIASVETLASRIRICIRALRANIQSNEAQWKTAIPAAKFLQICDEIVVSVTAKPGYVVCGPYDAVRRRTPLGVRVPENDNELSHPVNADPDLCQIIPKVHLENPSNELIHAVIILHHHKLLTEPSVIISHGNVEEMCKPYDVACEKENETTFTIL